MHVPIRRTATQAVLALAFAAACAPAGEPIIAPLPQGAALDTAGRPYLRPVEPPPSYLAAVRNGTRSATGAPGSAYWQQGVRYDIRATLEPGERRVTATERIVYHNRSPNRLGQVVFNLYQNLFTEDFVGRTPLATGGLTLTAFVVGGDTLRALTQAGYEEDQRRGRFTPGYLTTGTLSKVFLPDTLAPGDSLVFDIAWNFRVPPEGAPRTGWEDVLGGRVFQVAQWYPQIATYDDVVGFDTSPYRGTAEFYLEYGDFDVSLTLPAGWTVGASGELVNGDEILRPEVRDRLRAAMATDSTVHVLPRGEIGPRGATVAAAGQPVTWRYRARDVRDFAWAASDRYQWDARRATLPAPNGGTRVIPTHTLFRPGAPNWDEAARFNAHSVAFHSRSLIPYAYPQITVTEGPVYGMEYPMIVFVGRPEARRELYEVVAHEVGHEWFPMMVGQDEAEYAWMDEGFTTFDEARAAADYFPDYDPWELPREAYLSIAGDKGEAPLMRSADLVFGEANGVSGYYKPGTLMRSLQRTLGDSVFFAGMRTYASEWTFKHPYPWDFFDTMERVAGRDLDWFWFPWFYRTVTMDQGISTVTPTAGGVQVTVRDFGQVPAPTEIVVTTSSGATVTETIPVERWLTPSTRVNTVTIPVQGAVTRVEIDPGRWFPDANRRNNVWTP